MNRGVAGAVLIATFAVGCGHPIFVPPAGPGVAADASSAWASASSECRGAQAYSAVLRLSGRAGSQRIWPISVETAVTPTQVYMSATFSGRSVFVLAGSTTQATLWLRRDDRVVQAPANDIINAILGLELPPDRLLALLTGCVTRVADVGSTMRHGDRLAVQTADARVFLEPKGTGWWIRAGEVKGFVVEFARQTTPLPGKLWIRSTPGLEPKVSLDVGVSDASITAPIPPAVFGIPSGSTRAQAMSLEELRSAGPWRKN